MILHIRNSTFEVGPRMKFARSPGQLIKVKTSVEMCSICSSVQIQSLRVKNLFLQTVDVVVVPSSSEP